MPPAEALRRSDRPGSRWRCRTGSRHGRRNRSRRWPMAGSGAEARAGDATRYVLIEARCITAMHSQILASLIFAAHQCSHVRGGRRPARRGRSRLPAPTPAGLGMRVGDRQQLLGQPDEILGLDIELGQRVGLDGRRSRPRRSAARARSRRAAAGCARSRRRGIRAPPLPGAQRHVDDVAVDAALARASRCRDRADTDASSA